MLYKLMDRIFNKRSMQYQLILTYVLLNLIPLIIVGSLSYREAANLITSEVMGSNDLLLQSVNRNVDSYLKEIYYQSEIFSAFILRSPHTDLSNPEIRVNMDTYVSNLLDKSDEYISVRVFSDDGRMISLSTTNDYKHMYDSQEELEWQKKMKNNDGNDLIFDIHPLEYNGIYSFTASRAIFDKKSGKRVGYISYDKSLSSFFSYFRVIEFRSGGIMQIIWNNDTYLYHSNHALIGKKIEGNTRSHLETIRADSYVSKFNGKEMIVSYNTLMERGLTVVGSIPLSELTTELQGLREITWVVCGLSLLLVFILSYYFSIYMTRPIQRLNNLMSKVERGDFGIGNEKIGNTTMEIHQLNHRFHSMVNTINQLIKTQYETELRKKDAELKALLMQINPHFLYNTLEVINGIADNEGIEQISEITLSLSKMLRYNIDMSKDQVTLAEEMENCRNYVLILKSRFGNQLGVQWEIDEQTNECMMVKMVMQPLIENSIRHGVEKS